MYTGNHVFLATDQDKRLAVKDFNKIMRELKWSIYVLCKYLDFGNTDKDDLLLLWKEIESKVKKLHKSSKAKLSAAILKTADKELEEFNNKSDESFLVRTDMDKKLKSL